MAGTQARAAELVHATDLSSGLASPDENGAATAAAGDGISFSYPAAASVSSSGRAGRGRGWGAGSRSERYVAAVCCVLRRYIERSWMLQV
jgi:hypothetical protein